MIIGATVRSPRESGHTDLGNACDLVGYLACSDEHLNVYLRLLCSAETTGPGFESPRRLHSANQWAKLGLL